VEVDRMGYARRVLEPAEAHVQGPYLGGIQAWAGVRALRVEGLAVYEPRSSRHAPLELEAPARGGFCRLRLLDVGQPGRDPAFVLLLPDHVEAHNVRRAPPPEQVLEDHLAAHGVFGEVYDHVEAFGGSEADPAEGLRGGEEPSVAADLDERTSGV
jgi:hypothetical protein